MKVFPSPASLPLEVLDTLPAIVWTADARTLAFRYVSRAAETILGYPVQEWIEGGTFWQDHIHPADSHIPSLCHAYTSRGEGHDLLYRMIARDGRIVWLRDQVRIRTLDDGSQELNGVMFDVTAEEQAKRALQQSEGNYRLMVHLSADAIGVHIDNRYVYVNPRFVELFGGHDQDDLIGKPVLSFVRTDFHAAVIERHKKLAAGEAVPMIREKLVGLDGRTIDAEVMALPITFDGKRAVQVVMRDIRDRVRAEDRIQLLAAGTNEMIWEGNLQTDEFWSNDAYLTAFGATTSFQTAHERWTSRLHPEDRVRVLAMSAGVHHDGHRQWSDEYRMKAADGSWAWILDRGRVADDDLGQPVRLIGALLDITPLREAEQRRQEAEVIFETITRFAQRELEDSEHRYRQLVQELSDVMYTLDRKGNIESVNQAFELKTGYEASQWIGRPFAELLSPESAEEATLHFLKSLSGADPGMHQYTMRSASGALMEIEVSGQPRRVNGEVVGTIGTARDVTERNQLQRNLEEARRLSSLGQLAASIAHEINNVLMTIQPFTDVLTRNASESAVTSAARKHINDAIARGKRITSEILLYANPKEPDVESIPAAEWFGSLAASVRSMVPAFISLSFHAESIPNLLADRHHLDQVVINLITNAKDAMPDGGKISIELGPANVASEAPDLDPKRPFARLTVRDTGTGIALTIIDSIFEPLFTTKRNGTGLGLPIARRLMRRVHGDIHVETTAGEGTAVHLYIPLDSKSSTSRPLPAHANDHRLTRVLLVEDDEAVADAMTAMFEMEGIEVRRVACGEDAMPALFGFDAQLLVVDVNLPGISGLEVCAQVREQWPQRPIIISTGHVITLEVDRHTQAILKPYSIEELLQAYERILAQG